MALTDAKKTVEVAEIETKSSATLDLIRQLEITDADSLTKAADYLSVISNYEKQVKTQKESVTKPLNAALKSYRDMFRPIEAIVADAKSVVKSKMVAYERKVAAEREAKMEKLEKRVEKGTMRQDTAIRKASELDTVDNTVFGDTGKATFSTVRAVEIDHMGDFKRSRYFDELTERENVMRAIMVEVRKDALGNKAQGIAPVEIPGVRVYDEKTVH